MTDDSEHRGSDKDLPALWGYKAWVFDCDGVLLNSNLVKTDAFYRAAEAYGVDKASALVDYHVNNGGVSRYVKFRRFLCEIVGRDRVDPDELQGLLDSYAESVWHGLMNCDVAAGLEALRAATPDASWLVVSGGDQAELRQVFASRGLAGYFNAGIYGSPDSKDDILQRLLCDGILQRPGVFVGDSQYDIEAAHRAGLDFIFLSDWSESSYPFHEARLRLGSLSAIADRFNGTNH